MPEQRPGNSPVRRQAGHWEVLIVDENCWCRCETEEHARLISRAPVLRYDALEEQKTDADFILELEELAEVFKKYGKNYASRDFANRALILRKRSHET